MVAAYWQAPTCYKGFHASSSDSASSSSSSTKSDGSSSDEKKSTGSASNSDEKKSAPHASLHAEMQPSFRKLLHAFMTGNDEYRKGRFKFIPRAVEAPWIVRKAVGTQPAILGNKLTQTYHADPKLNYLEASIPAT